MKGWLFLVIAIVGEVIATSALKSSEGFTKLAPSAVVIIGTVAKLAMRQPFV
ncbi:TPA: SMR family transporter, partial [Escherichia coli]